MRQEYCLLIVNSFSLFATFFLQICSTHVNAFRQSEITSFQYAAVSSTSLYHQPYFKRISSLISLSVHWPFNPDHCVSQVHEDCAFPRTTKWVLYSPERERKDVRCEDRRKSVKEKGTEASFTAKAWVRMTPLDPHL